MATVGWYGPLIDLSKAASHVGDFVQLLVLVLKSTPIQYKLSKGGEAIRTDIQVGDETKSFFSVSLWKKQMGSLIVAGNIILLENVRVTRLGDVVEARTIPQSSLRCLVHPYESIFSDVDNLIENCRVGIATREKLRKVIEWVQRVGPARHNLGTHSYQGERQLPVNWKLLKETQHQDCFSLSEVLHLTDSCKTTFFAFVGEIFLPITWKLLHEFEEERMFVGRRLCTIGDRNLTEDLICTGCQLCGTPLSFEIGSRIGQDDIPLYCQKGSNRLHLVSLIYRPFLLYIWDDSNYIPLAVTNKAAELLFGNIKADSVYSCYREQCRQVPDKPIDQKETMPLCARGSPSDQPSDSEGQIAALTSTADDKSHLERTGKHQRSRNPNFYSVWLILLQTLLQPGKNSPLKFKVRVDVSKDVESGRYEMLSMSLPVL